MKLMTIGDMTLFQAEPHSDLVQGNLAPCLQVCQSCDHRSHEDLLFHGFFIIADRLDHGDTPDPAREQHRPGHLGRVFHDTTMIRF